MSDEKENKDREIQDKEKDDKKKKKPKPIQEIPNEYDGYSHILNE